MGISMRGMGNSLILITQNPRIITILATNIYIYSSWIDEIKEFF
jgi:hypothetical protein